jgi:ubiquinone/menaquinone biosynthesis C-methylase UbiE
MLNRRDFFPLVTATAAAAAAAIDDAAAAAHGPDVRGADVKFDPAHMSERELARHSIRLPQLDRQSSQDFLSSLRTWLRNATPDLPDQLEAFAAGKGIAATADLSLEEACTLALQHPKYAARSRIATSVQQLMWSGIADVFHKNADFYLAALEATDNAGPGTLELNPQMHVPEYTRYEIHIQPGGYVGDPFAGAISLYGFKHYDRQFLFNDHQEHHLAMAQELPLPADGSVNRILDMGCGFGGLATAMKERFPAAEVWGIDVGGPMVRWAHHRAVKMGIPVHFAQRLAEDSKFEAASFDIVASYIMFHEVSADAAKKIVAEAHRVLRPGGIFRPIDFVTRGNPAYKEPRTVAAKAAQWMDHRYNFEVWALQYRNLDFPGLLRSAGFDVTIGPQGPTAFQDVTARKRA